MSTHFRVPLLVLAVFTALGAFAGGVGLLLAPDGHLLGWSVNMLEGTPFSDYTAPGLMLLVVLGGGHAAAAILLLGKRRTAPLWIAVAGVSLSVWILTQLVLIGFFWLQAVMLTIGLVEFGLGLLSWRAHAPAQTPDMMHQAERFLVLGKVAFVGLSRDDKSFSRQLSRAMTAHGLDVVGVNPKEPRAPDTVGSLLEVADLARRFVFVLVPSADALEVVKRTVAAHATHIWFHQGAGPGSDSPEALALAQSAGLAVVYGLCPFMLLEPRHWLHGLHRDLRLGALGRDAAGR